MKINVCEVFKSIQGEGRLQGVPSIILRLTGCNLNCDWCDTSDTLKNSVTITYTEDELIEMLAGYNCSHIVITGGEPTLFWEIEQLIGLLKANGYYVTVETNATKYIELKCDLVSMSPKLSNSIPYSKNNIDIIHQHNRRRINIEAIKHYVNTHDYQIKFVCRDLQSDFDEVRAILEQIGDYKRENIMIMPLAGSKLELEKVQKGLVRKCVENGIRYANRLQLQIWDNSIEN